MNLPRTLLCSLLLIGAPALTHADLADGLAVYLPLQADLLDHSVGKVPVKPNGNIVLRDGGAYFGGDGNWLELPFLPLAGHPFAVSLWVRPTGSFPTYGLLQQYDQDKTDHILHLVMRDGLHPWFGFYMDDTVSPIGLSNAGGWQHLVFQYADGAQEIWINGRLICRRVCEAYQGNGGAMYVGKAIKWDNVPAHDFEGYLRDVRIYTARALEVKEVKELARQRPPETPGVRAVAASEESKLRPEAAAGIPLLNVNGGVMRLNGSPGEIYTVDASSDLQHWETLGVTTVGEAGYVEVIDPQAGSSTPRYYRLRYGANR